MRRYRAYVQPLMALLAVCILLITGGLYMLSNRLVSNSYAGLSRQEISQCVSIGQRLLADYRSGEITLDELREAVNPTLNPAEAFLLLTDPEGNVLCATEAAADLLSALPVRRLIQGLTQSEEPQPVVNHATEHTLLLMGQRTPEGAVLAGKSLSAYTSALGGFPAAVAAHCAAAGSAAAGGVHVSVACDEQARGYPGGSCAKAQRGRIGGRSSSPCRPI